MSKGLSWVRDRLIDRGYNQKDVAKKWGCDDAVVSRFLKQGTPPLSLDRAGKLSKMIGLSVDELMLRINEGLEPPKGNGAPVPPAPQSPEIPSVGDDHLVHLTKAIANTRKRLPEGWKVAVAITNEDGEPGL